MKIAPSIMCADLLNIEKSVAAIEDGQASSIHVDIMDGRLVPCFTFGAEFVKQLAKFTRLPIDVHLMSEVPEMHVSQFLELPIDSLTVHVENSRRLEEILRQVRSAGCRAGVALNPETEARYAEKYFPLLDIILIMSVQPGFVNQPQAIESVAKASRLVQHLKDSGYRNVEVVLDGGVKPENLEMALVGGVNKVVSGTGVFRTDMSPTAALDLFQQQVKAFESTRALAVTDCQGRD